jgi:hypothetical protein
LFDAATVATVKGSAYIPVLYKSCVACINGRVTCCAYPANLTKSKNFFDYQINWPIYPPPKINLLPRKNKLAASGTCS